MGLVEAGIPAKHKAKFLRAVAARRTVNQALARGKQPTSAQINADYKAMNALPLWLQPFAASRAS